MASPKFRFTVKVPNTCFGAPRGWLVYAKANDLAEAEAYAAKWLAGRDVTTFPAKYQAARIIDALAPAPAPIAKAPRRRIRMNVWGNWYGYEAGRKVAYFAETSAFTQQQQAEFWLQNGTLPDPNQPTPTTIMTPTTTTAPETTTTTPAPKAPAPPQIFGTFSVTTLKAKDGQRAAKISRTGQLGRMSRPQYVPRDICGLAAGRDAWMRKITFPCDECGERAEVGTMENGYCPTCTARFEAENEAADAGTGPR
jgi:hypothetical protein